MHGAECPGCKKELMTYGEFFRNAEPHKKYTCQHCGIKVRRSRWVWVLLLAAFVVGGGAMFFLYSQPWDRIPKLITYFLGPFALAVGLNFISWKYIRWVRTDPV